MSEMHDVISSIEKTGRKYVVYINEREKVIVPWSLFNERPLEVGQLIDRSEYESWLMVRQFRHALDRAVKYLSLRARSEKEVKVKLIELGYLEETAEMVVYKLREMNILNDGDFARQWISARQNKKIGKNKIKRELYEKGISQSEIENELMSMDDEKELEGAKIYVSKIQKRYEKDDVYKAKQKIMQALVRRGYSWEIAKKAIELKDYD